MAERVAPAGAATIAESSVAYGDTFPASREGEIAPGPDGAYSWAYLASIGGTAAAVLLIVQYLKGYLDKLVHIHTRLVVLALSIVIQIGSKAVLHGLNWPDVPLLILNGFVAATSAMGMYEVTFAKKEQTPKVGL